MKELTLEQKIIEHLAKKGYITNVGDVTRALQDVLYADKMITAQGKDGLKDDIEDAILKGEYNDIIEDCDHEALSNEEIQEVFDNDNMA